MINIKALFRKQNEIKHSVEISEPPPDAHEAFVSHGRDICFEQAGRLVIVENKCSIGLLQRKFRMSPARSAALVNQLYSAGVVGPEIAGSRKVLMTIEDFEDYLKHFSKVPAPQCNGSIRDSAVRNLKTPHIFPTLKEYAMYVQSLIDKHVDFSHDGESLEKMKNLIVVEASDQAKFGLLNDLICHNTCVTLKVILFDKSRFSFFDYKDIPNLFCPILTTAKEFYGITEWCHGEFNNRLCLFLDKKVKDISEYNQKAKSGGFSRLPIIVLIISEVYELEIEEVNALSEILLDFGRKGIFAIGFSKLKGNKLRLGSTDFLWDYYVNCEVASLFTHND